MKLPSGITVRGGSLRINFYFRGVRCYETLDVPKINNQTVKYAETKLRSIKLEIKEKRFDYGAHFPNSEKAALFAGLNTARDVSKTVSKGVDEWLSVEETTKAKSTYRNYVSKSKHVKRYFGEYVQLREVTSSDLKLFRAQLLKPKSANGAELSPKTVNDVFTIVRGAFGNAFEEEIIKTDPCERITNLDVEDQEEADPFERSELDAIAACTKITEQERNLVGFNSWAGLSVSEIMALAWEDVDFVNGTVKVNRALVDGEFRVPKEVSRVRVVELLAPALESLNRQKQHTFIRPPVTIHVKQRNNNQTKKAEVNFVFINPKTDTYYSLESLRRSFKRMSQVSGVRYRSPNQCRHTFASQALSSYVDQFWIARQLGHTSIAMLKKHYGRWIPKDVKSMVHEANEKLGFTNPKEGQNQAVS